MLLNAGHRPDANFAFIFNQSANFAFDFNKQ
jgi:hypothetical protein